MNRYRMAVNRSVIKAMASRGLTLMLVFFLFFGCWASDVLPKISSRSLRLAGGVF